MKVKTKSAVIHNGKIVVPGRIIEVPDKDGEILMNQKAAEPVKKDPPSSGDPKKEELMKLTVAELQKIGKELGAKETTKEKLVDEIITLQKAKGK